MAKNTAAPTHMTVLSIGIECWCCQVAVLCLLMKLLLINVSCINDCVFIYVDSFSSQPKSKPCLVKRTSSCDMSDNEYVGRDGTVSEGAVGGDSATLTAMQLTTLTLAVSPGTIQRRASPCNGIVSSMYCIFASISCVHSCSQSLNF